ncbi:conserved hypothetical protein [Tenacibaculum amylolyticum]
MGGHGSIQPVLKNNKNLLRKKSLFKDQEKRFKIIDVKLKFKKATEEELELHKEKIRERSRRARIPYYFVIVTIVILIGVMTNYLITSNEEYKQSIQQQNLRLKKEQLAILIEKGDVFYAKEHYKNALFFYKKGQILFPKDAALSLKIKDCYQKRCERIGVDCEKLTK